MRVTERRDWAYVVWHVGLTPIQGDCEEVIAVIQRGRCWWLEPPWDQRRWQNMVGFWIFFESRTVRVWMGGYVDAVLFAETGNTCSPGFWGDASAPGVYCWVLQVSWNMEWRCQGSSWVNTGVGKGWRCSLGSLSEWMVCKASGVDEIWEVSIWKGGTLRTELLDTPSAGY